MELESFDNDVIERKSKELATKLDESARVICVAKSKQEKKSKVQKSLLSTIEDIEKSTSAITNKFASIGPVKTTSHEIKDQIGLLEVCYVVFFHQYCVIRYNV